MVGLFGGIRFRVSDGRVLTFRNFKKEISSDWNSMERIGQKPLLEFGGPKLQTISFEITLDASLGVPPRNMLNRLERMAEGGEAYDLVIGKKRIGSHPWVITKCSQAWNVILRKGEIYRATVTLSLQEYV